MTNTFFLDFVPYEDAIRGVSELRFKNKIKIEKETASSINALQHSEEFLLLIEVGEENLDLIRSTLDSWSKQSYPSSHTNISILNGKRSLEIEKLVNEYPNIKKRCTYYNHVTNLPASYDEYFSIFASVGTRLHPSLCYFLSLYINDKNCDFISWNSQECQKINTDQIEVKFIRRPEFNKFTIDNINYLNLCFSVKIYLIKRFYHKSMSGIIHSKAYEFLRWLSRASIKWAHCPFYLSINYYEPYIQKSIRINQNFKVPNLISIIMCFRDSPEITCRAIESILKQRLDSDIELILINNQSTSESLKIISSFLLNHDVNYHIYDYDFPFNHSKQNNIGISLASGEVCVLLNNDIELISKNLIQTLAEYSLLSNVGTVGCQILSNEDSLISAGITARNNFGPDHNSPVEESKDKIFSGLRRETFANTFACVCISMRSLKSIGLLDEVHFPIGYNDVEYCLRASRLNLRHLYLGDMQIKHLTGSSRGSSDEIYQKIKIRENYPEILKNTLFQLKVDKCEVIMLTTNGR